MIQKILSTSAMGMAAVMLASAPAMAKSNKSSPLNTVGQKSSHGSSYEHKSGKSHDDGHKNTKSHYSSGYPGKSGDAPGRCVSDIAKPHHGYGISDEIKKKCKPVSR